MALTICPACGKPVSSNAPACPNCGEPLKSSVEKAQGGAFNLKDPVHLIGAILALLIVAGVIYYIMILA